MDHEVAFEQIEILNGKIGEEMHRLSKGSAGDRA